MPHSGIRRGARQGAEGSGGGMSADGALTRPGQGAQEGAGGQAALRSTACGKNVIPALCLAMAFLAESQWPGGPFGQQR